MNWKLIGDITATTNATRTFTIGLIIVSLLHVLPIMTSYAGFVTCALMNFSTTCIFGKNEADDVYVTIKVLAFKQIVTIFIILAFVAGGAVFCFESNDQYNSITSTYWAIQTVSTVGMCSESYYKFLCLYNFIK